MNIIAMQMLRDVSVWIILSHCAYTGTVLVDPHEVNCTWENKVLISFWDIRYLSCLRRVTNCKKQDCYMWNNGQYETLNNTMFMRWWIRPFLIVYQSVVDHKCSRGSGKGKIGTEWRGQNGGCAWTRVRRELFLAFRIAVVMAVATKEMAGVRRRAFPRSLGPREYRGSVP